MDEINRCPLCKSENYFMAHVSSTDGYSNLISYGLGIVNLLVCSKCGCVFVAKHKLNQYEEFTKERRKRNRR